MYAFTAGNILYIVGCTNNEVKLFLDFFRDPAA